MNGDDRYTPTTTAPAEPSANPWEDPAGRSRAQAFWITWKDSVFRPTDFFGRVAPTGSLGPAIGYFVVLTVLSALIGTVWNALLGDLLPGAGPAADEATAGLVVMLLAVLILAPIFAMISLFIAGGIFHLILMIVGGANNGFVATLRALCYAAGPALFAIVPFIGQLIGMIWGVVLAIVGVRELHRTQTWKAATAVLVPTLLLGMVIVVVMLAVAAAGLLAGS